MLVLLLDDKSASGSDLQLQSIAHGVIMVDRATNPQATQYLASWLVNLCPNSSTAS